MQTTQTKKRKKTQRGPMKKWTPLEEQILKTALAKGMSRKDIAKFIGRNLDSVQTKIAMWFRNGEDFEILSIEKKYKLMDLGPNCVPEVPIHLQIPLSRNESLQHRRWIERVYSHIKVGEYFEIPQEQKHLFTNFYRWYFISKIDLLFHNKNENVCQVVRRK